jgi:hypothetical protein
MSMAESVLGLIQSSCVANTSAVKQIWSPGTRRFPIGTQLNSTMAQSGKDLIIFAH